MDADAVHRVGALDLSFNALTAAGIATVLAATVGGGSRDARDRQRRAALGGTLGDGEGGGGDGAAALGQLAAARAALCSEEAAAIASLRAGSGANGGRRVVARCSCFRTPLVPWSRAWQLV